MAYGPILAAAIPELKPLLGFDQHNPNHAYDLFTHVCKLLPLLTWQRTVAYGPILAAAIPELKPLLGFDQHNPNHAYDLFTHVAHVVGAVPPELPLRWAALLHDIGKVPTFTLDENGRGHSPMICSPT